jgi:multiple sugar transport system permease protein
MALFRRTREARSLLRGLGFVSPWLIGFCALTLYPFLATLYWSFCRYDLLSEPQPIGAENYARLADELIHGGRFGQAVWNTFYYAGLSIPLSIALGVGLAMLLSVPARGQSVYRTLVFLPSVVPVVAGSILWMWILDPQAGIANRLLGIVGIAGPGWFKSTAEAAWLPAWFQGTGGFGSKDALVLMSLWGVGNFMIIYLAALGDIPKQLYEAAALDGAGAVRRFWHVTLPLLTPVIFFNLVIGLIHALQAFAQIYIVSEGQGAPHGSTLMLSLHLFLSAFKYLDMGYASAMAWTLFVIVLLVTIGLFRSSRRWVYYQGIAR